MSSSARNDVPTFIALCGRFGGIGTSRPTVVTVLPQHCDNTKILPIETTLQCAVDAHSLRKLQRTAKVRKSGETPENTIGFAELTNPVRWWAIVDSNY